MNRIEVTTQTQLDKALKNRRPGDVIVCLGGTWDNPLVASGSASVWAYGSASVAYDSASVRAYGSASVAYDSASVWAYDSASVEAYGSASVWAYGSASVWAYGSASVEAYGSASVWAYGSASVWAYDSASVRAYDSASVRAYDSASVRAAQYVAVHKMPYGNPKITGGVLIDVPDPSSLSPADWCDYYGVKVTRGTAYVFKALDDDYSTDYARSSGIFYTPGSSPKCDDFNTTPKCGGGLHVSPSPAMAAEYNSGATRYVCCPVKLAEMVVLDDKAKVPRVSGRVFEVGRLGERL